MNPAAFCALIVDDSSLIRKRIHQLVIDSDVDCTVEEANNYKEAVILLQKSTFHLALLDINLPGKSGIELLEYIKLNFPEIKTIMLTNQSGSFYRNRCMEIGVDGFVDKSSEFEKLPDMIHDCLAV